MEKLAIFFPGGAALPTAISVPVSFNVPRNRINWSRFRHKERFVPSPTFSACAKVLATREDTAEGWVRAVAISN
jgi:hypothetical protein